MPGHQLPCISRPKPAADGYAGQSLAAPVPEKQLFANVASREAQPKPADVAPETNRPNINIEAEAPCGSKASVVESRPTSATPSQAAPVPEKQLFANVASKEVQPKPADAHRLLNVDAAPETHRSTIKIEAEEPYESKVSVVESRLASAKPSSAEPLPEDQLSANVISKEAQPKPADAHEPLNVDAAPKTHRPSIKIEAEAPSEGKAFVVESRPSNAGPSIAVHQTAKPASDEYAGQSLSAPVPEAQLSANVVSKEAQPKPADAYRPIDMDAAPETHRSTINIEAEAPSESKASVADSRLPNAGPSIAVHQTAKPAADEYAGKSSAAPVPEAPLFANVVSKGSAA